jgi:hypothetical protein
MLKLLEFGLCFDLPQCDPLKLVVKVGDGR